VPDDPAVTLRARTDADLDVLYRISADLDTWEERNSRAPSPMTRKKFDTRLARSDADDSEEKTVAFVVDVDGTAVGSASLSDFDLFVHHAQAGIALLPETRGRGIGTAAIRELVLFGFLRLNLRRIHLQAIASNAAALRAYEKAGFVVEGRLREHAWVRGVYEDIVLMGILRSEQAVAS
jgi:RimJ/RimL family protein N-acetyltransferase